MEPPVELDLGVQPWRHGRAEIGDEGGVLLESGEEVRAERVHLGAAGADAAGLVQAFPREGDVPVASGEALALTRVRVGLWLCDASPMFG